MIYSVVPPELADELYERLVRHYADNPHVTVIVDRRVGRERRTSDDDTIFRERRFVRDRRRAGAPAAIPEWFGEPLSPEEARERARTHRVLRAAIVSLPERQRLILVLNAREELSYSQMAEVLGLSETQVAELHARALGSLQRALTRTASPSARE